MQYLPSFLCELIDAVAYKQDPGELQEDWDGWRADFDAYYARESDYSLSDEDQMVLDNIPPLLEALDGSVRRALGGETAVLEDLVKNSVAFFDAHDKFYNERERLYFVQSAPMDRLLKASIAHLQGRAGCEAIHRREVDAALAVKVLHDVFQVAAPDLPEDFRNGTIDGFRRAQKGFHMLADHPEEIPHEVVEEAVFEIKSAGELLEHLPNLMRKFQEQRGCVIPVIGEIISALRGRPDDEELITIMKDEVFPSFLEMWDTRHDGWLLEPEVAHQLLDDANQLIGQLAELVEIYPESEEEFWQAVEQTEDVFAQIRDHTMQLEGLRASAYWPESQMMLNMLRGGTPRYAARSFVAGVKEGDAPEIIKAVGRSVEAYLKEEDPVLLLEALHALQVDQEMSKTTRPCASCGARIPLEAKECPSCHATVEEFSLSG
jgi:hypothetical protein